MGILTSTSCVHVYLTKLSASSRIYPQHKIPGVQPLHLQGLKEDPGLPVVRKMLDFTSEPRLPLCALSLLFWNFLQCSDGSLALITLQTATLRP